MMFGKCADNIHRYEARYDKGESQIKSLSGGSAQQIEILMDGARKLTYVHDICVRCGKVIKR